eukprot:Amastigsp_a682025_31.p1 type:complete len:301 gc:universal Amastigsp_a682025_31:928-26(-)
MRGAMNLRAFARLAALLAFFAVASHAQTGGSGGGSSGGSSTTSDVSTGTSTSDGSGGGSSGGGADVVGIVFGVCFVTCACSIVCCLGYYRGPAGDPTSEEKRRSLCLDSRNTAFTSRTPADEQMYSVVNAFVGSTVADENWNATVAASSAETQLEFKGCFFEGPKTFNMTMTLHFEGRQEVRGTGHDDLNAPFSLHGYANAKTGRLVLLKKYLSPKCGCSQSSQPLWHGVEYRGVVRRTDKGLTEYHGAWLMRFRTGKRLTGDFSFTFEARNRERTEHHHDVSASGDCERSGSGAGSAYH